MRGIYAILDHVSGDLVGGLHLHKHQATAVRFFGDIANMQNSQIAIHPNDFALVLLGTIDDQHNITPARETVLEGATWAAAQKDRP